MIVLIHCIKSSELDAVVFYDKPFMTFERLLLSYLTVAPKGLRSWLAAIPLWFGKKLHVPTELVDLKKDGSIRLNLSCFDFLGGLRMTNQRFAELFGGPPRQPETEITQKEMDIAASIQPVTEETVPNLKIKYRESFRPFAPTVLEEKASEYFDIDRPSPYMLLVANVKQERCLPQPSRDGMSMLERLKVKRSDIPAITHLDYSARLQTVNKKDKPDYHNIISEF